MTEPQNQPTGAHFASHASRYARRTALFSAFTLLSRITGLLRVMAFAAVLGSGRLDDAYQLANNIPNIIYEFIMGGLLSAIFIPLLVREQEKSGKTSREAWGAANLLLGYVGIILAAVSALVVILSPVIIQVLTFLAKDHHAVQSKDLATYFLRFFAPQMLLYGLNAVFMAILNSHDVFGITAAAPIFNNVTVIATLAAYRIGVIRETGLAIGTTAGVAAMALIQVPWLWKIGMPIRPKCDFRDPMFGAVGALALPVLGVSIANLIGTAVRTNLLYTISGAYTIHTFCFNLIMMPYGVFAVSLATVLYPALSRHAAETSMAEFRHTLSLGIRWTTLVMLPVALGISVLAEPTARVLFERGQFTYADTLSTAAYLRLYALSILPYSVFIFATRAFYALKDTTTPAWISVFGVAAGVILSIWLMKIMGAPGVALSAVATNVLMTAAFFVTLRRKIGVIEGWQMSRSVAKMAAAGAAMAVLVYAALRLTEPTVQVIEKGPTLQDAAMAGSVRLVRSQAEWASLWSQLGHREKHPPKIDFRRKAVAVVAGPESPTTSVITLGRTLLEGQGNLAIELGVCHSKREAQPPASGKGSSQPYLLALVPATVREVRSAVHSLDGTPEKALYRSIDAFEAMRLLTIIAGGALVYLASAFTLRTRELNSLMEQVRKRVRI